MVHSAGIVVRAVREFMRDRGPVHSAALSFLFMLEAVPFVLFIIGLWGFVLGSDEEMFRFILDQLLGVFPSVTSAITHELESLVTHSDVAFTSLFIYALLSYQLYWGLSRAMVDIFKAHESKVSLVQMLLKPLALVSIVFVILFAWLMLTALVPVVVRYSPFDIELGGKAFVLLRFVLPFLSVLFAAFTIYKLVPPLKVHAADALWGGFFTAIIMEAAKNLFTWYVGSVGKLGTMYGSLTAIVTFLIWLYFSWAIFLVGAEIVHLLGESRKERGNI